MAQGQYYTRQQLNTLQQQRIASRNRAAARKKAEQDAITNDPRRKALADLKAKDAAQRAQLDAQFKETGNKAFAQRSDAIRRRNQDKIRTLERAIAKDISVEEQRSRERSSRKRITNLQNKQPVVSASQEVALKNKFGSEVYQAMSPEAREFAYAQLQGRTTPTPNTARMKDERNRAQELDTRRRKVYTQTVASFEAAKNRRSTSLSNPTAPTIANAQRQDNFSSLPMSFARQEKNFTEAKYYNTKQGREEIAYRATIGKIDRDFQWSTDLYQGAQGGLRTLTGGGTAATNPVSNRRSFRDETGFNFWRGVGGVTERVGAGLATGYVTGPAQIIKTTSKLAVTGYYTATGTAQQRKDFARFITFRDREGQRAVGQALTTPDTYVYAGIGALSYGQQVTASRSNAQVQQNPVRTVGTIKSVNKKGVTIEGTVSYGLNQKGTFRQVVSPAIKGKGTSTITFTNALGKSRTTTQKVNINQFYKQLDVARQSGGTGGTSGTGVLLKNTASGIKVSGRLKGRTSTSTTTFTSSKGGIVGESSVITNNLFYQRYVNRQLTGMVRGDTVSVTASGVTGKTRYTAQSPATTTSYGTLRIPLVSGKRASLGGTVQRPSFDFTGGTGVSKGVSRPITSQPVRSSTPSSGPSPINNFVAQVGQVATTPRSTGVGLYGVGVPQRNSNTRVFKEPTNLYRPSVNINPVTPSASQPQTVVPYSSRPLSYSYSPIKYSPSSPLDPATPRPVYDSRPRPVPDPVSPTQPIPSPAQPVTPFVPVTPNTVVPPRPTTISGGGSGLFYIPGLGRGSRTLPRGGRRGITTGFRRPQYTASFAALELGISSASPRTSGSFTGFEIRPFVSAEGNQKSNRKKKKKGRAKRSRRSSNSSRRPAFSLNLGASPL